MNINLTDKNKIISFIKKQNKDNNLDNSLLIHKKIKFQSPSFLMHSFNIQQKNQKLRKKIEKLPLIKSYDDKLEDKFNLNKVQKYNLDLIKQALIYKKKENKGNLSQDLLPIIFERKTINQFNNDDTRSNINLSNNSNKISVAINTEKENIFQTQPNDNLFEFKKELLRKIKLYRMSSYKNNLSRHHYKFLSLINSNSHYYESKKLEEISKNYKIDISLLMNRSLNYNDFYENHNGIIIPKNTKNII